MLARSPLHAPFERPDLYFASVTAHGTLMAYVLPTLFVMGFGYFVAVTALDRPLPSLSCLVRLRGRRRRHCHGDRDVLLGRRPFFTRFTRRSSAAPSTISGSSLSWSPRGFGRR